jgi:hypothetical protein
MNPISLPHGETYQLFEQSRGATSASKFIRTLARYMEFVRLSRLAFLTVDEDFKV